MKFILSFFLFALPMQLLFGQCPTNIGFESNSFAGWTGYTGTCCPTNIPNQGIVNGRHTIMSGSGLDPTVGALIPVVPPNGSNYAVRIGNDSAGSQAEMLEFVFNVTAANSAFLYWYAIVMEDGGHQAVDQPVFSISFVDSNSNLTPCGLYQVSAGPNLPGFSAIDTIRYKTWGAVNQDLSPYIGQQLTIRISTGDCALGGHSAYAYFDALCDRMEIVGEFCHGDSVISLIAPDGFPNYLWTPGGVTTQSHSIVNPTSGTVVSVQMQPYTGAGCVSTITDTLTFLEGAIDTSLSVTGNTVNANDTVGNFQWISCDSMAAMPGETNQSFTATAPGSYAVVIDRGYCRDTSSCVQILTIGRTAESNSAVNLFPNPSSGEIRLQFDHPVRNATVEVVDAKGMLISSRTAKENRELLLETGESPGVYLILIHEEGMAPVVLKAIRKLP